MGIDNHALEEFIKTDREVFRAQATDALRLFTPDDRELAASLQTEHTSTDDILRAWAEQIEPIHQDLEQKRSDTRFKNSLIKALGFGDGDADRALDYLIDERKQSLLDEVLGNLYPSHDGEVPFQRHNAQNLLAGSDTDINDFFSRYIDFSQAIDASEKHHVLLCDPHSSWLERQRTALQINKERQRTSQDEDTRLEEIEHQLEKIAHDPESLVGQIVAKEWNFITILDLRSKYQKHVDGLSKDDLKNPNKRLKLFERVTQSFRDREAEKLTKSHGTQSLKALRKINEDVYDLLLEIFDLDATKRNRLLLDIQRHTRLSQERDLILLIQRNREQFLS
ncbi:MAG: hypothetical protein JWP06_971 [Candidatus Saccharibacteria bacterium]|nr:hypothetical protein [Candidatus Saccharibacteria bacterium]